MDFMDVKTNDFNIMIKEIFKGRQPDGTFKEIVWNEYKVNLSVIPLDEIIKFAVSSCNKCYRD